MSLSLPASPPSPPPPPATPSNTQDVVMVDPLLLPDTMNPEVFISRLQMLRASKDDTVKRLIRIEDDPALSRRERLTSVFKALYRAIVSAKGEFKITSQNFLK